MGPVIGVAPRTRREPSGVCVVETENRRGEKGQKVEHFVVRYLESLPAGTSFPAIADRCAEVAKAVEKRTGSESEIYIDATGFGAELVDEVKRRGEYRRVYTVYFTHGDRRLEERGEVRLGKAWLVTRVQLLLQTHRLHLPKSQEAERLAQELIEYEVKVAPDANDRYGAFRVGTHDELVTALGLAVQAPPTGAFEYAYLPMLTGGGRW
jgi:hypothetical protein